MLVWMISYESLNLLFTKPSLVIHHYKPECHVRKRVAIFKVKVTVTECGFIQWNHDYFYHMLWTVDFLATSFVWQCMFISWSVLWKGCFAVFKVTVMVLNFSECLPGQYLWPVKLSMVIHHHQPEYHSEISFCNVQGQSHNHFRNTETFAIQISLMVHHHKTG